ncbi:VTT domain-containing protein [Brevibacterium sp. BRM-1]|uniref:DedA family protein n=1 Tax=Brevibacterium sp. BRM-1 TaxID=2999062 RepID=UPI0022808E58|nr:VTT domain-containing protein [Brevibacterium sp. BRM-1]WAL39292.1 VTT domain-containing protein [Brevibacterium sp. BRM-1]
MSEEKAVPDDAAAPEDDAAPDGDVAERLAPQGPRQVRTMRDLLPWEGTPRPSDRVLLAFLFIIPLFYLVMWPLRPMLIAKMPVLLSFLIGAKTVVAGAGAFAAVESHPLWIVVAAGWAGMMKFDWLWWFAGRRWGERIVSIFANTERTYRRAEQIRRLPRWLLIALVVLGRFPGVPGSIVWLISGWSGMRFWTFFLCNAAGALVLSWGCAWIGFEIGQPAVDLLKLVDKYALWVSLAIIVGIAVWSGWKEARRQSAQGR